MDGIAEKMLNEAGMVLESELPLSSLRAAGSARRVSHPSAAQRSETRSAADAQPCQRR
jgi:hypothetical protein